MMDLDEYYTSHSRISEEGEPYRLLIIMVLRQSILEYLNFTRYVTDRNTAEGFLFDDNYRLYWGDWELSPAELLDIAGVDLEWVRRKITESPEQIGTHLGNILGKNRRR